MGNLTCVETQELLALAALGVLPAAEGAMVTGHIEQCATCRATGLAFQQTAAVMPTALDLLEPPASLRRTLLAAVYADSRVKARRRGWRWFWERIPQSRAFTLVAVGGVAATVALAVWGATLTMQSNSGQTYQVAATTTAPAVHGTLTYYSPGARSVISVTGLPAPLTIGASAGSVYEVWLIPRSGSPQPAAFLALAPQGATWTAVVSGDVRRFQSVATTVEPAGGATQPTGPEVFSVALTS